MNIDRRKLDLPIDPERERRLLKDPLYLRYGPRRECACGCGADLRGQKNTAWTDHDQRLYLDHSHIAKALAR